MGLLLHDGTGRVLIWRRDQIRHLGYWDSGPESLLWPMLRPGTRPMAFDNLGQAVAFLSSLMGDPMNRQRLRRGLAQEHMLQVSRWSDHELLQQVAAGLLEGGYKAVSWSEEPEHGVSGGDSSSSSETTPLEDEEAARAAAPPPNETPHFIEIELIDEAGEPIADERYFVELPDGSKKSGRTDSQGFARIDGVDPGTAKVSFPDRDKDAYDSQ